MSRPVAWCSILLLGCGGGSDGADSRPTVDAPQGLDSAPDAPSLDPSRITAGCFQGGATPELQLGDGFSGADWNDPHVMKVGAQYWLYASSNQGFAPAPPSPVQVYRWTSTDAATWTLDPATPVLSVSAGAWDQGGNETPAVVSFGGTYHMFWVGYPDPWPSLDATHFRIGHATSVDGVTWVKDAQFLLGPSGASGTFDELIVAEPGPVVFDNQLYLYFTAVGFDAGLAAPLQTIGVVTSTDGLTWSTPALAFKPDQSLYPRAANWVGYSTPSAAVIVGKVHVFVDVANDHGNNTWTQEALHHASSADGRTGWIQDTAPLRRLSDFAWTQRELRSPMPVLDGTTLRLYFAGDDLIASGAWGIGQITCALGP